ncbi:FAD-binding oxidoreductase [Pelagibius sp. Alg239-R121]|uniref:NAD(P)/FAD-dependent oxidoreductase n=1 Tax=Pelagibius sp. Alg239-R121 TaxID=2993448 RepID=UPI0024A70A31|nr:FAD-dependent oxidoreductase [Pelagibius sp. Alg239-R121]
MSKSYDAIVIGAGVIGCAIAFEMAKSGKRVLGIEKNAVAGSGSTGNSCAIIRTHYSTLDGAALAKSNYPYWENWADYVGAEPGATLARYREVGCLYTCFEENNYGIKLEEIANTIGIPYEVWTPSKMRDRLSIINPGHFHPAKTVDDPEFGLQTGEMRYVLFFPKAGFISDPMLATQNLQSAATRHGAEFIMGQRVEEIFKEGGRVTGIALEDGREFHSSVVINASGPHSYKINDMAGVSEGMNIKTKALRVEVAHVPSPDGFDFERNGYICSDADIGGYWRPEVGNKILIGSEEPECDPLEWVDPDDYNTDVTEQARLQAMRGAQRFPSMGVPNSVQGIADLYDASDDWIPIYDCSDLGGFYMAIGTSGNQFKNAPVVGMMMNALVDYVEGGADHDKEPLEYPLPNMDYVLNMRFCSRKREINSESSFSVVG